MKTQIRTQKLTNANKSRSLGSKAKKRAFKDDIAMITGILAKNKQKVHSFHDAEHDDVVKELAADQKKHVSPKAISNAPLTFFYTNEKYLAHLDDVDIASAIAERYPNFLNPTDECALKMTIIDILTDKNFVLGLVEYYNMTLQDFLKFMFKRDITLFKGPYLAKIQKTLANAGYEL